MCKKMKSCSSLNTLYKAQPMSEYTIQFLQQSICFKKPKALFVCCPDAERGESVDISDTTGAEVKQEETSVNPPKNDEFPWLTALKKKVPQPPICGTDAQDKIFGGEIAEITDFPWTVLLEYEKRKVLELPNLSFFIILWTLQLEIKEVTTAVEVLSTSDMF